MSGNEPSVHPSAAVRAEASPVLDLEAVYDELFPFVWRTARRLGVAEGALDDVCQEVFLVVHRRLPEFEGRSSLKTWVFSILENVVQVHRRSLSRKSPAHRPGAQVIELDALVDPGQRPDEVLSSAQAARIAHEILERLDDDKRTAFVLAEIEQMPVSEIAVALGANVNTVHARLRAARRAFSLATRRYWAKERFSARDEISTPEDGRDE
jgi:RNA polymerase sigma-70 factor (ECF subfamily)